VQAKVISNFIVMQKYRDNTYDFVQVGDRYYIKLNLDMDETSWKANDVDTEAGWFFLTELEIVHAG
jgi:hypothetical protein